MNWRRAVSAILAVGLRPCSGALIVLVFSLSQDSSPPASHRPSRWAWARADGRRAGLPGGGRRRRGQPAGRAPVQRRRARLRYGVEALAALAVLLLGILLLGGMLAGGG